MKKLLVLTVLFFSNAFGMQKFGMQGLQSIAPQAMAVAASVPALSHLQRGLSGVLQDALALGVSSRVSDTVMSDLIKESCSIKRPFQGYAFASRARGGFGPTGILLMKKSEAENILNLSRGYTLDDAKKNYKSLAKKWHPDVNQNNKVAAEKKFKEILEAYEILQGKRAADPEYSYSGNSGNNSNQNQYNWGQSSSDQKSYESDIKWTKDDSHRFWNKHTFSDAKSGEEFSFRFPKLRWLLALWLLKKAYNYNSENDIYNHDYENLISLDAYAPWNWQRAEEKRKDYLIRLSDYAYESLFMHAVKIQDRSLVKEMLESGRITEKEWSKAVNVMFARYSLFSLRKVIDILPESIKLSLSSLPSCSREKLIKEHFDNVRYFMSQDRFNYNENAEVLNSLIRIALDKGQMTVVRKVYKNSDVALDIDAVLNYVERYDNKLLMNILLEAKSPQVLVSVLRRVLDGKGYSFAASCVTPEQKVLFEKYKSLEAPFDQKLYKQAEKQGKKEYANKSYHYSYESEDYYINKQFQDLKKNNVEEYKRLWFQVSQEA